MRRKIIFAALLVLILMLCGSTLAETVLESDHPYARNSDITWEYTHDTDADILKVTFSEETNFESDCDYLYVTDSNGNEIQYTGSTLSSKPLYLSGSSFTLRLTSDNSSQYYGFAITEIVAMTQEEYNEYLENYLYTITDDGIITDYNSTDTYLVIPDTLRGIPVTAIGDYAFEDCVSLISVTIPDGVTTIGNNAFICCTNLTSITIPDSITTIGSSAFNTCTNLTSITIPDAVTAIGNFTFNNCTSLTNVIIPDGVTAIGNYAFVGCTSLTSVSIPKSVSSLGDSVFCRCSSLTSISIPEGITSIGNHTFYECTNLSRVVIPDSVTSIGDYAFYNCRSLTNLLIPDGVTSIGKGAFQYCTSLADVNIPDSITSLGSSVFYVCTNLTSVTIPDGITSIGDYAFWNCKNLISVFLPEGITSIGSAAFCHCSNLEYISFAGTDMPEIVGDNVFYNSNPVFICHEGSEVEKWAIENGFEVQYIEPDALILPANTISIEIEAFVNAGAEEIVVPNGCTSISSRAFADCSELCRVVIPASVTDIADDAFENCPNLTISAPAGSAAETYANARNIPFIAE